MDNEIKKENNGSDCCKGDNSKQSQPSNCGVGARKIVHRVVILDQ